ncbi:MAG: phosphatidylserine decarboxylase [Acidisphaera sp.]|nr:phosphatidylserine decarboxylase [Acidisphaera sp.]
MPALSRLLGDSADPTMIRALIARIAQQDDVNFLLTNRLPRRLATRFMGWFSRIEQPLVCAVSLRVWRLFSDIDLSDAEETRFRSLHHCFTRRLKEGARPIETDPQILVSPCDGIIGATGRVQDGQVLQVKGFAYSLAELLGDAGQAGAFDDGTYVTLRLTSGMYHRFHAPHECRVMAVTHVFGDRWNVNPATLRRVERLFCRNERAVIRTTLAGSDQPVTLVAVAAILVAGIRLRFLDIALSRGETRRHFPCDVPLGKGEEMGWFEHGSTIVLFAPAGFAPCDGVREGLTIRAGRPLLLLPATGRTASLDAAAR